MKKTVCLFCLSILVFSCTIPRYSYVPPALNNIPYSRAGEGQLAVQFGSVGMAARGGIAVTKNINLNAWVGAMPSDTGYNGKESEFSIGVQTNPDHKAVSSFYLGYANGSNKKIKTGLSGHYSRSFFQWQHGGFDLGNGPVQFDAYVGLRINYLDYEGTKGGARFFDHLFYYEPYFGGAVGGKNVRFQLTTGMALKNSGEWGEGVRIFPFFMNVGVVVKIRKGNAAK